MKCPKCHSENPETSRYCSNCATLLSSEIDRRDFPTETLITSIRDLAIGSTFSDRYQVIEELGEGGMGKVYKVHDTKIDENVALKLLNPEISADKNTIERFRNELKFARKISHRNVCRMFDLSEAEGVPYITMEYVPGEDLKSLIKRIGQFTVGKAVFLARQVGEGLSEAHRLGVIHRDLKPQNIMIDREGNARIMDFGISRFMKAKGITDPGVVMGTPEYMSPEQVEGKEVDQRSDIYTLGIILYELVTGRVPFEGGTPLSVALKQKTAVPLDPREINPQIPEDLSRAILKCMEKDKRKRYQAAEELLSRLRNIEKGIPTTDKVLPKRKPITSKEITVKFSVIKLLRPVLYILAAALLGILIWRVIPQKEAVSFPSDKFSLAVMYFENNTGDEKFDHWRKALADLLIADLSQSKYIRVVSSESLFNILEEMNLLDARGYSSKDLGEVARRGGIENILVGKFAMAGETFRINAMLQKASTGELLGSESVEGEGEGSIFSMVDELTRKIKENFKLSAKEISSDIDAEVGKITTSSTEAYRYYRDGIKFQGSGDYPRSIALMEMAVGIDPEFAMAYSNMATAYRSLGYGSEARERLRRAFELSDRVSDRERYLIQGSYYWQSEKTFNKAIEVYNQLLRLYPEDASGNNSLGYLYADLEQWDKAIERYEVNIHNIDNAIHSYENLAYAYMAKGLYDKAEEILEFYINNFSDNAAIHSNLAINYLCQRKFDLASAEVEKAFSLDPMHYGSFLLRGDINFYQGALKEAEREYLKLLESKEPPAHDIGLRRLGTLYLLQGQFEKSKNQAGQGVELAEMLDDKDWESWFRLYLAYLNLKSGDLDEALVECNLGLGSAVEADSLSAQRNALHLKGIIQIEMRSIAEAQKTADALKSLIENGMNKKTMRLYHHLMGLLEINRNNFSRSIESFQKALSLLPYQHPKNDDLALFIDPLAFAYYKTGDLKKAQEEYEEIASLTTGRLYYEDVFAKGFYMLGKIFQETGEKEKARENYSKFLELWKEADPGTPEVVDAQNRLASLRD